MAVVDCPICEKPVNPSQINHHIDSGCTSFIADKVSPGASQAQGAANGTTASSSQPLKRNASAAFFSTPGAKRQADGKPMTPIMINKMLQPLAGKKRTHEEASEEQQQQQQQQQEKRADGENPQGQVDDEDNGEDGRAAKRSKTQRTAPLAERMRPQTLDEVCGQELVGGHGVLRSLVESGRVPSMVLWGASGTGKTTIARCIARHSGARFVELNATSTGVSECKRIFGEAASELALTGRKTIIFCDELHRFNKAQQDVFLRPVEAGTITLIGATTENPSFRIASALLSRCRTFTLPPLSTEDVVAILARARSSEAATHPPAAVALVDDEMLLFLARFSDGDARTALNLLELALSLASASDPASDDVRADIRRSLTKTLVYDRAGDQHFDSISAFHKSVRGGDADATLYYLARMLQSGEDPLFVARRMVVIASEDVGLADSSLLPLAVAAYTAAQQIGMPEARIPLAHCAVALCLAPKSTRAYRGLNNAYAALREPGVAALPVPLHLRNAPTRMMRDLGFGAEYKYPPNYRDGKVRQSYLPDELRGRCFLEERDLGTQVDPEYE